MDILSYILVVLRCVIAFVFVSYGISKILAPKGTFAKDIAAYKILPTMASHLLATILPVFEVVLGILVLFSLTTFPASIGLFVVLIMFQIAIGKALITGLDIDCGCVGKQRAARKSLKFAFVRNWALLLALIGASGLQFVGVQIASWNIVPPLLTITIAILFPLTAIVQQRTLRDLTRVQQEQPLVTSTKPSSLNRRGFLLKGGVLATSIVFLPLSQKAFAKIRPNDVQCSYSECGTCFYGCYDDLLRTCHCLYNTQNGTPPPGYVSCSRQTGWTNLGPPYCSGGVVWQDQVKYDYYYGTQCGSSRSIRTGQTC